MKQPTYISFASEGTKKLLVDNNKLLNISRFREYGQVLDETTHYIVIDFSDKIERNFFVGQTIQYLAKKSDIVKIANTQYVPVDN